MPFTLRRWRMGDRLLDNSRHTLVMGVVNVTPDSFSDGGLFLDPGDAVRQGVALWRQGADLVDVGGESTRPGSHPVEADEELRRVGPVVEELAQRGVAVSIDTNKPEVAEAALRAGALVVNDVTALADRRMGELVADAGAGVVLMHMQGNPRSMQQDPRYADVVAEVGEFLRQRAAAAEQLGISAERICLDPGIGFGKQLEHNLALLAHLDELVAAGYPVMVGTSRKSFIGRIIGDAPIEAREEGTAASVALAIERGVTAVRVHDVTSGVRVARVADAIVRARR